MIPASRTRSRTGSHAKRIMTAILCLVAAISFTQVKFSTPAQAATSDYWSVVRWDITGLGDGMDRNAERNYRSMIRQVRELSGSAIGANGLMRTTEQTERYIEVQVVDFNDRVNNHRISLYLRLDNLYLDGFTIVGHNYLFQDAPAILTTRFANHYPGVNHLFQRTPYRSTYGALANAQDRGNQHFNGRALGTQIIALQDFTPQNWNDRRQALAAIIGATAEAARFGWIENRIGLGIGQNGQLEGGRLLDHLGPFGAELENNWEDLSELVRRQQDGRGVMRPINIDGRTYHNIREIQFGVGGGTPAIGALLTHGSAR
ncbi:ribosome-inactivating family protein [Streptomyces sp. NPDC054949]